MKARASCGMAVLGLALAFAAGTLNEPGPSGNVIDREAQCSAPSEPVRVAACASDSRAGASTGPLDDFLPAILKTQTDPSGDSGAIQRAADSVPDTHLRSVLDVLLEATPSAATELSQVLIRRWAERDLPAAAAWAERLAGSAFQGEALRQVALAWADRDLAAAAEWAKALPDDLNKAPALAGVAYEACRTEPLLGLDLMLDASPGPERDVFLVHAVNQWAGLDSSAAFEWALQVPEHALRGQLLATIAVAIAEREGAAAARLVANSLPAGPEQERAAVAVAQCWATTTPRDAASWAACFPESLRTAAVQNVVTLWRDQDSAAATAWLEELPDNLRSELGSVPGAKTAAGLRD